MRCTCSLVLFAALMFWGGLIAEGQSSQQSHGPQYGTVPDDLANALVQMARSTQMPLVAELVWPLPKVPLAEGTLANEQTLNQLVKQAPEYEWSMEGKVLHFYNKKLRQAQFNFLNLRFPRFTIPPNLSDFKLWFPGRAAGLLEGYTGEGGAITGFGDAQFEKRHLQRVTLQNITPLGVLIRVATEAPIFYTVIVFPNASPTKEEAEKQVNWQWGNLNEKLRPIYTQPPSVQ